MTWRRHSLLTSEGTVYPLLNRMRDAGSVTSDGATGGRAAPPVLRDHRGGAAASCGLPGGWPRFSATVSEVLRSPAPAREERRVSTVTERDDRVCAYLRTRAGAASPAGAAGDRADGGNHRSPRRGAAAGSNDDTVMAVLRRLGCPRKLAAEARAPTGSTTGAPGGSLERLAPPSTVPPARWGAIAAGLAVVCALSTWLGLYLTTPSLSMGGSSSWLSPQDQARWSIRRLSAPSQAPCLLAGGSCRGSWSGRQPQQLASDRTGACHLTDNPRPGRHGRVTDAAVAMSTYSNYTGASAGMLSLHYTVPETIQPVTSALSG